MSAPERDDLGGGGLGDDAGQDLGEDMTPLDADLTGAAEPEGASYRTAHPVYRAAGWLGPLPLPTGQKWPPPDGYTGHHGELPSWPDSEAWSDAGLFPEYRDTRQLALRMGPWTDEAGVTWWVAGIDVDHYGHKRGAETLAEAQRRWGPLPPAPRSSARGETNPSGIRFFLIPAGTLLRTVIGFPELELGSIEIIQRHHRYAVAWPSTNPDADGAPYLWYGTRSHHVPPNVATLHRLPERWLAELESDGRPGEAAFTPEQVVTFEREHSHMDRSASAKGALAVFALGVQRGKARHDAIVDAACMAAREARSGAYPAGAARTMLREAFVEAVATGAKARVSAASAAREFENVWGWAVSQAAAMSVEDCRRGRGLPGFFQGGAYMGGNGPDRASLSSAPALPEAPAAGETPAGPVAQPGLGSGNGCGPAGEVSPGPRTPASVPGAPEVSPELPPWRRPGFQPWQPPAEQAAPLPEGPWWPWQSGQPGANGHGGSNGHAPVSEQSGHRPANVTDGDPSSSSATEQLSNGAAGEQPAGPVIGHAELTEDLREELLAQARAAVYLEQQRDDYARAKAAEQIRRKVRRDLDAELKPPRPSIRSRLVDSNDLERIEPPRMILGEFLPAKAIGFIGGDTGTYKSFVAVSWACSLAAGRAWQDDPRFSVSEPVRCLYVAAEGGGGVRMRVEAWRAAHGALPPGYMVIHPEPVDLTDEDQVAELAEVIAEDAFGFVVIDTLHQSAPGSDDNSATEFGVVFAALNRIRHEHSATVLIVDHSGHDGGRLRGTAAKGQAADFVVMAQRAGDNGPGSQRALTITKRKDLVTGDVYPIRLREVTAQAAPIVELGELEQGRDGVFGAEREWWSCAEELPDELVLLRGDGANIARDIFRLLRYVGGEHGMTRDEIRAALAEGPRGLPHRSKVAAAFTLLDEHQVVEMGETASRLRLAHHFTAPQ